jgi:hypothetical protein
MSSVLARYEVSGERRKPKPSGSVAEDLLAGLRHAFEDREHQFLLAQAVGVLDV